MQATTALNLAGLEKLGPHALGILGERFAYRLRGKDSEALRELGRQDLEAGSLYDAIRMHGEADPDVKCRVSAYREHLLKVWNLADSPSRAAMLADYSQ